MKKNINKTTIKYLIFSILIATHFPLISKEKAEIATTSAGDGIDAPQSENIRRYVSPITKEKKEQRKKMLFHNVCTGIKNVDFTLGGLIATQYFYLKNFNTLGQKNYYDENGWFRQKGNLSGLVEYGVEKYGQSAGDAFLKLSVFNTWRNFGSFTPMTFETITLVDAQVGQHQHTMLQAACYLEDAWLEIHFGTFFEPFQKTPHSLKLGYFGYYLGRGVSLGDYYDLGVTYMGWGVKEFIEFPYTKKPGILWHGTIWDEYITYDLYYQKWRERTDYPGSVLAPVNKPRLRAAVQPESGIRADWDLWSGRLDFTYTGNVWDIHAQPYILYHLANHQGIEFKADVDGRLGTYGMMVDFNYDGLNINVEAAGQFGAQTVQAIDRNIINIVRDSSTGQLIEQYSHLFFEDTNHVIPNGENFNNPAPVVDTLTNVIDQPYNRNVNQNGKVIIDASGTPVLVNGKQVFNSDLPYHGSRFRDGYKISFGGFMVLADIAYQFHPIISAAVAGGYISGDSYPYNEEVNKKYGGFLTLQDAFYNGYDVNSFSMLYARTIPRPVNISQKDLFAFDNFQDMSNLQFISTGLKIKPFKDKEKLLINPTIHWFWEAHSPQKWDKNAVHPDPEVEKIKQSFGIQGWESHEKANSFLGTELTFDIIYTIFDAVQFQFLMSFFFPGDLYEDINGQPNDFTRRVDEMGKTHYDSLGNENCFSILTGFTYTF